MPFFRVDFEFVVKFVMVNLHHVCFSYLTILVDHSSNCEAN
jgi:hypothetical protein